MNKTRKSWLYAVGIMLATCGVYALLAGSSSLWDRDEGWFTRPTVEMVESGDYLVPRYNGEVWTDKPILTYWVQAMSTRLFGRSELAFRLPEIVGMGVTCLLTFAIAVRLVGETAGLWAMVIMASSLMAVMVGTLATADGVLMPFLTAAMAIYVMRAGKKVSAVAIAGIGLAVGVAALAKGPMGFLPVVAMAGAGLLGRKQGLGGWKMIIVLGFVIAIGTGIFLAWAIPADKASGGAFLDRFVGREIWHRATSAMEGHGGDFFKYLLYYIPVIIAGFFPWTLHLPGAISMLLGGRLCSDRSRAILLGWMVPVVVLMSLAATKLPHYIVFIWPAMAVAVGAVLVAGREGHLDERDRKWLRGGVWFFGPVAFGMATALIVGPWFANVQNLKIAGAECGVVLLVTGLVAVRLQLKERFEASAKVVLAGMTVFMVACSLLLVPAVETVKITPSLSRAICQKTGPQVPVAAYRFHEPSMFYYIGRHIEKIGEGQIGAWAKQDAPGVLVITKMDLAKVESSTGPLGLDVIADVTGFNYSKGKWTEVLALEKETSLMVHEKKQDTFLGKGFGAVGLLAAAAVVTAFLLDEMVFQYLRQYHTDWYKNWYVVPVAMLGKGWLIVWLLTGWYVAGGQLRVARAGLLSLLLVACIVGPLKVAVGRIRPEKAMDKISMGQPVEHRHSTNASFPSGDTAVVFAVAAVVVVFAGKRWGAGAMVIAGCVAFLRVVAMAHYPSDVFGGAAIGVLCGVLGVSMEQRWVPDDFPQVPRLRSLALALLVVLPVIALQRSGAYWIWVFLCFYVPLMGMVWCMRTKGRRKSQVNTES